MTDLLHFLLVGTHAAASSVWLGSMCYSLFVFAPRMSAHLDDVEAYEEAARALARGMRYAMIAALSVVGVTGIALLLWPGGGTGWWVVNAVKLALFLAAVGLFAWVTLKLWPERVFATADELPAQQRRAARVAAVMLAVVVSAYTLGIVASHWPGW